MNRHSGSWTRTVIALTTPLVRSLGIVVSAIYAVFFRWWLDKRIVRKSNERFANEILGSLPFLFADYGARVIPNDREPPASFDFAYVTVSVGDLVMRFCRGLGTVSIDVSSVRNPKESHDLSSVLNTIDSDVKRQSYSSLSEIEPLLRSHMKGLLNSFSEQKYAELARHMSDVHAYDGAATRQWEAETNRRLYEE